MNNIILIIFLLVFTVIVARNIKYGIYSIIFLMPLYLWRFSVFGIPTTVLEVMIYILFLVWVLNKFEILKYFHTLGYGNICLDEIKKNKIYLSLLYSALNEGFARFSSLRKSNFLLFGILLLFIGLTISTSYSSDLRTSLGIFKGWFIDPFLFFIVFINVIKKREYIFFSLKSWAFSGVFVSLIGVYYLLNKELTFDGRLRAFFLSPNHLAMYLTPTFLLLLFFLLFNKKLNVKKLEKPEIKNMKLFMNCCFIARHSTRVISKIFDHIFWSKLKHSLKRKFVNFLISNIQYLVFIIIIFVPLYFTYSYGAFLGIFVGILYLVIKNRELKIKNIYLSGFILFLFLGFIFISSNKMDQIINSSNRSSFHSRLMIWNSSVKIIKGDPLFGIGPGTFQEKYLSYSGKFGRPYLEWAVPQPHNIFLAFYLQTGLIGFIGFILILVWFFWRSNNELFCFRYIINALMIYTLIHGLIDTTYWKNDLSLMFWLIIGLAVVDSADFYKINHKK